MSSHARSTHSQSSSVKPSNEPHYSPTTPEISSAAEGGPYNPPEIESRHDYDLPSFLNPSTQSTYDQTDGKATYEMDSGYRGETRPRMSPMQLHVKFFDLNDDGRISPLETFLGFRALGFNLLVSFLAIFLINLPLAYISQDSWIPDPRLYIYIKNIHRAKHGSDSDVYDRSGNFQNEKFEEIFNKFSTKHKDHITFLEGLKMTESFRQPFDLFGWFFSKLEFGFFFILCSRPLNGSIVVSKEMLRANYDGSLFYKVKQENNLLSRKRRR